MLIRTERAEDNHEWLNEQTDKHHYTLAILNIHRHRCVSKLPVSSPYPNHSQVWSHCLVSFLSSSLMDDTPRKHCLGCYLSSRWKKQQEKKYHRLNSLETCFSFIYRYMVVISHSTVEMTISTQSRWTVHTAWEMFNILMSSYFIFEFLILWDDSNHLLHSVFINSEYNLIWSRNHFCVLHINVEFAQ